jgi:hypothetical protein
MHEEHQTDSRRVKNVLPSYVTAQLTRNITSQELELKTTQSWD